MKLEQTESTGVARMRKSAIKGIGYHVPAQVITNHDLIDLMETSEEWIKTRSGIEERHWVQGDEAASDLAFPAAKMSIENAGITPEEIDLVVVATLTADYFFPGVSSQLQDMLGLRNVGCFDIRAACSGFVYALSTADQFIRSGMYNTALVIGAEAQSKFINKTTEGRDISVLFGDGAGAVLLEPSEEFGIIDSELRIDGTGGEFLRVDGGGSLHPASHETVSNKLHYVRQDGKTVYKFAVRGMADISYEVAERNNLKGDDISLFIPHQANKRIIDAAAKRLGLKESQVMINIDTYANTTSATIPICIAEVSEKNMLNIGDNVIISTFGAGFSWGAMYLKWGMQANA